MRPMPHCDAPTVPRSPPVASAPRAASRSVRANNSPARSLRRVRHRRSELPEEIPVSVRPHWQHQDECESTEDLQ